MTTNSKNRKRDPRITAYITEAAPFARPILRYLRRLIHEACPDAEEAIKWGMPSFIYNGKILCGIAGFKAHCALWFWQGSSFIDAKEGKTGKAMGSFGRITSLKDLPSEATLKKYVKQAMQLNEAAQRTSSRRSKRFRPS